MLETIKDWFWGTFEWFRRRGDLSYTNMSYSNIDGERYHHIRHIIYKYH